MKPGPRRRTTPDLGTGRQPEPPTGIEPVTSPLPRVCSTTELRWHKDAMSSGSGRCPSHAGPAQVRVLRDLPANGMRKPSRIGTAREQCSGPAAGGKGVVSMALAVARGSVRSVADGEAGLPRSDIRTDCERTVAGGSGQWSVVPRGAVERRQRRSRQSERAAEPPRSAGKCSRGLPLGVRWTVRRGLRRGGGVLPRAAPGGVRATGQRSGVSPSEASVRRSPLEGHRVLEPATPFHVPGRRPQGVLRCAGTARPDIRALPNMRFHACP